MKFKNRLIFPIKGEGWGDTSARQEMIRSIRERRMAEEEKIDADRRELAEMIERVGSFRNLLLQECLLAPPTDFFSKP